MAGLLVFFPGVQIIKRAGKWYLIPIIVLFFACDVLDLIWLRYPYGLNIKAYGNKLFAGCLMVGMNLKCLLFSVNDPRASWQLAGYNLTGLLKRPLVGLIGYKLVLCGD